MPIRIRAIATFVLEGCPQPAPVQTFLLQAFGSGSSKNTPFTRGQDDTWTFIGSSSSASWSGSVRPGEAGTVSGSVTYVRASGGAGGSCQGVSRTYRFQGLRGQQLVTTP